MMVRSGKLSNQPPFSKELLTRFNAPFYAICHFNFIYFQSGGFEGKILGSDCTT